MAMSGKQGEMNRARGMVPGGRVATKVNVGSVGPERHGDPRQVQEGGSLAEAAGELRSQHPHPYHDHGPHHGTTEHLRHKPHVKPNGGYGR
jgi:hypothetical protein